MANEAGIHPKKDDLLAFGLGKLPPDDAAKIETHLDECPSCCDTLLDLQDDTFLALVKKSPPQLSEDTDADGSQHDGYSHTAFQPTVLESGDKNTTVPGEVGNLPRELQEHNRYRILEHIGHGGMGDVYKAEHMVMNRLVALKVIKPELVQNKSAIKRFHREVQAAARLHHTNIVTAFDAEQVGNLHFLVMEFVDGVNLDEVLKERGPLPVAEACNLIRQTAMGLEQAHAMGMVHRDIKPHNLMLTEAGDVKILDFGLASFASHAATEESKSAGDGEEAQAPTSEVLHQLTQMGTMMGTPDYIAPEQAKDARKADIRADIYSLGCTFYALLTGKPPFKGDSVAEKLSAHAQKDPEPLSNFRNNVPTEVEAVLKKMMAKDPTERYQTPKELVEALRAFIDQRIDERLHMRGLGDSSAQPPAAVGGFNLDDARRRLQFPANGLLTSAIVGFLSYLAVPALFDVWNFEALSWPWKLWLITTSFLLIPLSLLMIQGGLRMRSAESRVWGLWTAVAALLPLSPVSWLLGLIFGTWSLVELRRPAVRAAFGSTRPPTTGSRRWLYAFATLTIAGYLAVGVAATGVFYYETDYGVVRVEVADESLHIKFAGETITVKDGERKLKIRPGKQKLFVKLGELEFYTDDFQLSRGDEFRFKVELQPGEIVVQKDGQRFSSKRWVPRADSIAEEWQRLAGRWQAVSAAESGRVIDASKVEKLGLVVDPEKRTMALLDVGGPDAAKAELDPSRPLKQIDISKDSEGSPIRGIYKLNGDNLTLCLAYGGQPRPITFTTISENGGGAQLFVFRRITGNSESMLTKEKVKSLVAEAAGISNADWAKIATATKIPTPDSLETQSLSLILFSLAPVIPEKLASDAPDLSQDFRYLTANPPKPVEIASAIWISKAKGYASFIQPEYITEATVNIANDSAHGSILFTCPKLYEGRVNYVARSAKGQWRIEELHLPSSGLSLHRTNSGQWKPASSMVGEVVVTYKVSNLGPSFQLQGQPLESQLELFEKLRKLVVENPSLTVRLEGDLNPHAADFVQLQTLILGAGVRQINLPPGLREARTQAMAKSIASAEQIDRQNQLTAIGKALRKYDENWGHLPPGSSQDGFDEQGRPFLSWRVHLLPFLGEISLHERFHLNEPWDSEHNKALLSEMPRFYKTVSDPTQTTLLAVIGEGTVYEGKAGLKMMDIYDGLSNTAALVDAGPENAVPWTKPEDLPLDSVDPIRAFGTPEFGNTFLALMADSSVKVVSYDTDPEQLRNLFLRADGNTLDLSKKRSTPLPNPRRKNVSDDPAVDKLLTDSLAIYTFEEDTFYREQGRMRVRDVSGHGLDASIEDDKKAFAAEGRVGGGLACNRSITGFAPKGLPGSGIKAGDQNMYELPMPKLRLPESFLVGREEYTVTAWVRDAGKATAPSGKSLRVFFQEGFPKGNNAIHPLAFTFVEQRIQAMCLGELIDPSYKNAQVFPAEDIIPKDEWFFLALTLAKQDDQVGLRITINDKTIEQPFAAIPEKPEGGFGLIGGIDGMIDELAFFKRALSEHEIQKLRQHGLDDKPLIAGKKPTAPLPSPQEDQVTLIREFSGHTNIVKSVDFSPDGKRVASASGFPRGDNSVRIWDRETGKELDRLDDHFIPVVFVTFSPDGKRVLSGDIHGRMILGSLGGTIPGRRRKIVDWTNDKIMIDHAEFTPDGQRIVYLKVNPHAANATIEKASSSPPDKQEPTALKRLEQQALAQIQRTIEVVDATNGKSIKSIPMKEGEAAMSALAVTPDGIHVAVPMYDGTVRLISLETEEEIHRYEPPKNETPQKFAFVAAVSPDGNKLAAGYGGHMVRVWDLKTGKVLADLRTANLSTNRLTFFSDNRRLAASGPVVEAKTDAPAACIIDTQTREILATTPAILGDGLAFALAPDENYLLTAGGAYWDATSLKWQGTNDYNLHLWRLPENVSN